MRVAMVSAEDSLENIFRRQHETPHRLSVGFIFHCGHRCADRWKLFGWIADHQLCERSQSECDAGRHPSSKGEMIRNGDDSKDV